MWWIFKRKKSESNASTNQSAFQADPTPDTPQSFGYKTTWWAIKSDDVEAVAAAIGLANPRPCNWATGIPAAYGYGIFVCPPIDGWILVAGDELPPKTNNVMPECIHPLLKLSQQFCEAQVYSTHRVVDYHVWARAVDGELVRGFGYVGESGQILWDDGDDETETKLDLEFPNADDLESDDTDWDELDFPNEQHVMQIAGEWSIAPAELSEIETLGVGLIGFDAKLTKNAV